MGVEIRNRENIGVSRQGLVCLVGSTAPKHVIKNLKQVNKKVGEGLATAIETGEKVTEKTKKTLGK